MPPIIRVGLISDTHGLVRPEVLAFLQDCDRIIHGGDIGDEKILNELASVAPVTAVRGNNDKGSWADRLRETELLEIAGIRVYVVHDLAQLAIDPRAAGIRVVVSGHSHKPSAEERDGTLYVNPGSAGPRRFKLPIAVGELLIGPDSVTVRTVNVENMMALSF
jgi:putative phosphoesterase